MTFLFPRLQACTGQMWDHTQALYRNSINSNAIKMKPFHCITRAREIPLHVKLDLVQSFLWTTMIAPMLCFPFSQRGRWKAAFPQHYFPDLRNARVLLLSEVLNSWDERKWGAVSPKERKSEQVSHVTQIVQHTSFWQVVPRKRPPGALFCWPLSCLAQTALWLVSHSFDLLNCCIYICQNLESDSDFAC